MGSKPGGYIQKLHGTQQALIDAGIQCGKQQIVDYLTLVLRDPDYVDKDIHGRGRIDKIIAGIYNYDRMFEKAYSTDKEADYYQDKLDDRLREVYGNELVPFVERQPDVLQPRYNKKKKGWVE